MKRLSAIVLAALCLGGCGENPNMCIFGCEQMEALLSLDERGIEARYGEPDEVDKVADMSSYYYDSLGLTFLCLGGEVERIELCGGEEKTRLFDVYPGMYFSEIRECLGELEVTRTDDSGTGTYMLSMEYDAKDFSVRIDSDWLISDTNDPVSASIAVYR